MACNITQGWINGSSITKMFLPTSVNTLQITDYVQLHVSDTYPFIMGSLVYKQWFIPLHTYF
jgi:hypothetical protein